MSVITASKPFADVHAQLIARGDLATVIVGCDKCAKTSATGGTNEVRQLRARLRESNLLLREVVGLPDAIEEGLCDPTAVAARLNPLAAEPDGFQVLALSCGAGLKCLRDLLPKVRLIPGLDTLGPGVEGELACLACGDCHFGEEGCGQLRVAREQSRRLSDGYSVK